VRAVASKGFFVDKSLQGAPWWCLVRFDLHVEPVWASAW
jgi:hypothetical protein